MRNVIVGTVSPTVVVVAGVPAERRGSKCGGGAAGIGSWTIQSPYGNKTKPQRNMAMSPLSPVEQKQLLATLISRKMMNRTTANTIPTVDVTNDDDDGRQLELSIIDARELVQTDKVRKALLMAANGIDDSSISSEYDRVERRMKLGMMNARTGTSKTKERDIQDKMNHFFSIHSNKMMKDYDADDYNDDDVEISSCESDVSDE